MMLKIFKYLFYRLYFCNFAFDFNGLFFYFIETNIHIYKLLNLIYYA